VGKKHLNLLPFASGNGVGVGPGDLAAISTAAFFNKLGAFPIYVAHLAMANQSSESSAAARAYA